MNEPIMTAQEHALVDGIADALFALCTEFRETLRSWEGDFDRRLRQLLRLACVKCLSRWFDDENERLRCKLKRQGFLVERHRTIRVLTIFGWVTFVSSYLRRKSDRQGRRPVNDTYDVAGSRATRGMQRVLTDFGCNQSFGNAAVSVLEHYNVEVSRSTIRDVTERRAAEMTEYQRERYATSPERPDEHRADEILLMLDGCMLRITERKSAGQLGRTELPRQQKVRVDRWVEVRSAKARRRGDTQGSFVEMHASYDDVLEQLKGAARERGRHDETRLVFVGDGANGLKEAALKHFPGSHFILDRIHMRSHLREVVRLFTSDDEACEMLVNIFDSAIGHGELWRVILELRTWVPADVPGQPPEPHPAATLIRYLERFADSVRYDEYDQNGWPLGSGEIESSHVQVTQRRLKIAGAAWTLSNLKIMAGARAVICSGQWQDYWQQAA